MYYVPFQREYQVMMEPLDLKVSLDAMEPR
jgi:hypothetical protein